MDTYQRLEKEFHDFVGLRDGEMVACSSGTAALHLALEALELPKASRVIMSDYNMIACPRAVTMAGLYPEFVDCNSDDLLLSAQESLLSFDGGDNGGYRIDISAILATHIYGRHIGEWVNDLATAVSAVAVIEDMSEIHGISPNQRSDAACWSFYKNKIIAGEEGGMIWFKDSDTAKIARELRSLGFNAQHDYMHRPRGHNYRLSNCHAELILKSLYKFPYNNEARNWIEGWYNKYIPKEWQMPPRDAVWVYDLRIPGLGYGCLSNVITTLNTKGIAARYGFKPMSRQPEYESLDSTYTRNATKAVMEVLYLPVYPSMEEKEVKANVETLIAAVEAASKM